MHFEMLVEDLSGKKALEILVPKIIGAEHTFKVTAFKGIGHIPKNMITAKAVRTQSLLNNVPRLLRAYGKTFRGYGDYPAAVILICDLDDKCRKTFRKELIEILEQCDPRPETRFCFAIEEGEAWFLGDLNAVRAAYPHAKDNVVNNYVNDSICGTWELLADAIYPGGSKALLVKGGPAIGTEKSKWSTNISPHMTIDHNASPSFRYFRDKMKQLTGDPE